jgi:hypothetical protein
MFAFVSAHGTQIVDYDQGVPVTRSFSQAGLPTPWLKVERQVGNDGNRAPDRHEVRMELFTWAWVYAFIGLSAASVYAGASTFNAPREVGLGVAGRRVDYRHGHFCAARDGTDGSTAQASGNRPRKAEHASASDLSGAVSL